MRVKIGIEAVLKYLVLIAVVAIVWWNWRKRARPRAAMPRQETPPEPMVACAYCGLYQPVGESLAVGDRYYCCEAHRRIKEGTPSS